MNLAASLPTSAWGMSDEDLYRQAMKAADESWAAGRPFLHHIMITSNHRLSPYPDGRSDIPSGSGRNIFTTPENEKRALIGNYQKLGLYQPGRLSVLSPKKETQLQEDPESDHPRVTTLDSPDEFARRNIAYYLGAAYVYKHGLNTWKS